MSKSISVLKIHRKSIAYYLDIQTGSYKVLLRALKVDMFQSLYSIGYFLSIAQRF